MRLEKLQQRMISKVGPAPPPQLISEKDKSFSGSLASDEEEEIKDKEEELRRKSEGLDSKLQKLEEEDTGKSTKSKGKGKGTGRGRGRPRKTVTK
jgi:hypothetical protein